MNAAVLTTVLTGLHGLVDDPTGGPSPAGEAGSEVRVSVCEARRIAGERRPTSRGVGQGIMGR